MFGKKQVGIILDAEAKRIMDMASEDGLEPNATVSLCVKEYFMPKISPELNAEAKYLIEQESKGELSQEVITNSLAKVLRWGSRYKINDVNTLRNISNHYPYNPVIGDQKDSLTEEAIKVIYEAGNVMESLHDDYNDFRVYVGYTTDALCDYWDEMKDKRIAYEVFEAMLSLIPQHVPFSIMETLYIMRRFEADVLMEHAGKDLV